MKISRNNLIILGLTLLLFGMLGYLFYYQKNNVDIKCLNISNKYNCWKDALDKTLDKQGLSASFEVLAKLYDSEPNFISVCHTITHELGAQSYRMYSSNQGIKMTPNAAYCGYGFYHGFMEALLKTTGDTKQAQDFCEYADKQLSVYSTKTIVACYHGIGHGTTEIGEINSFEEMQKLIEPGLKICRALSGSSDQIKQCGTGVFNSLAIALSQSPYALNNLKNPYEICLSQKDDFKGACYEQMNTRASALSKGNIENAIKFVISIPDKKYSMIAMAQLIPAMISNRVGQNTNFDNEIKVCIDLPEYLVESCINGLVGGIMEFGKPDYEYIEANKLCESFKENEVGKSLCYKYVISNSHMLYSKGKIKEVCGLIDEKYRTNCNNE